MSRELRPTTWGEVAGQKDNIRLLKAIVKAPEKAPRCLILCGEFGTGKCVDKNTRVLTNKGYLRIKDLVKNPVFDEGGFMDISDKNICVHNGSVASHFFYGGKTDTISISSPYFDLTGTPEHKVMARKRGENDFYWVALKDLCVWDEVMVWSGNMKDFRFNNPPYGGESLEYDCDYFMQGLTYGRVINLDMSNGFSNEVFSSNKEFLAGFLRGIIESFGHELRDQSLDNAGKPYFKWGFSSKVVAIDLREILRLFGVFASVTEDRFTSNKNRYCLQVDSGLGAPVNCDRFKAVWENRLNSGVFEDDVFVTQILKIGVGNHEVYDLSVPEMHAFMSNGLISHNTTCARILARELNGIKDKDFNVVDSKFYYEFDSTVVGNVDEIRKMQDMFSFDYGDNWRVVVFDEAHSCSNAAQNALLKMLEENNSRTFFCFATTEVRKLLPTIRSRSLELQFTQVPIEDIKLNLSRVGESIGVDIPEDIKSLIADRSDGHMRNAHLLLDRFLLLGPDDFKDSVKSAVTLYCDFLIESKNGDKESVLRSINDLLNIPKDSLKSDWNKVMTESMKFYCGFDVEHPDIKRLVTEYKRDFQIVVTCYMSSWMRNAFIDMAYFQATFLNMYASIMAYFIQKNRAELEKKEAQKQKVQVGSVGAQHVGSGVSAVAPVAGGRRSVMEGR